MKYVGSNKTKKAILERNMADKIPKPPKPEAPIIRWTQLVDDPVRVNETTINCTLNHPVLGLIPFSATENDPMDYGRAIYRYLSRKV